MIPEALAPTTGDKLVHLLDYLEQVVRLDERTVFALGDYRLADGSHVVLHDRELADLPGLAFDGRDEDGPVWLRAERLARLAPPEPPIALAPWLVLGPDPAVPPHRLETRLETVSAAERNALLAGGMAAEEDFSPVPERPDVAEAPRFDRRVARPPDLDAEAESWIAGAWHAWAEAEILRRRTIAVYGALYKLQQILEGGGADSPIELLWGIGPVRWTMGDRVVDRPLIERAVEIELDPDGTLRVRPRATPARIDLRPYEELGCQGLPQLDALIRHELARSAEDEGVVPFRPETFEPILVAAAARLAPNGRYRPADGADGADGESADGPLVTGGWVLFARPRSRHVVLDDIARLRTLAETHPVSGGLAERLVTPPERQPSEPWEPLGDTLGAVEEPEIAPAAPPLGEVFFPKPFNEDQVAIARRLAQAEGLVVQGPPGTGKTHTIANLICHAMALGQRVLVVSRGEAALAVLRDQIPEKVRPLAISILSSERQGLRQVETAVREIQSVVEESRPEIRRSAIRRCEAEILKVRARIDAIDAEIDAIADLQTAPIGPSATPPGDLARRLAADASHRWFTDRPESFAAETGLADDDMTGLAEGRRRAGHLLDHLDIELPARATLPDAATLVGWHEDLRQAALLAEAPSPLGLLPPESVDEAAALEAALRGLATASEAAAHRPWLAELLTEAAADAASPWLAVLESIVVDVRAAEAERLRLAAFAVEMPDALPDDEAARGAVERAAGGERPWSRLSVGHSRSKELFGDVRVRGAFPGADASHWRAVADHLRLRERRQEIAARWRALSAERGSPAGADPGDPDTANRFLDALAQVSRGIAALRLERRHPASLPSLATDAAQARALADDLASAISAARLAGAGLERGRTAARFAGEDRTSRAARRCLTDILGRPDVEPDRVEALWSALLDRIAEIEAAAGDLALIRDLARRIEAAGAPAWAERLRREPPEASGDALLPADWRAAWDAGAAVFHLARIDRRAELLALSREREAEDRRGRRLFTELVRERAFLALERRLSPGVKSALVEYVRALGRLGRGTGKGAGRHRRTAREALDHCYDAIPCWIMPTWRVAELLPAELGVFDLVILDEASQSDVTELPALLRARKILAVGDDRQVSPTPPFVTQARIEQLRHHYLRGLPFGSLLEPGESLYDLLRAVFPDSRIMLKEHFRCVEPIIRFSMQFYPEKLLPLRVPLAAERIDPPLVDIFVPHGMRDGARKINRAEADVIVEEIAAIVADPTLSGRSIGVISLIGADQAELVRVQLAGRIGEEAMQRHAILCGDSAAFQGNERDIVFLSMVADRRRRLTLTMARFEQRFNVAVSRARDRLVLVRSVALEDLNPQDLKARLIAHFDDPLPSRATRTDLASVCESEFERDLLRRLLALGYRVEPQVGAEGFRIDLVVEGDGGRRLAVECDGDSFHGPAQWREDMRRQRILERVGWRFWRCFASNFYRDPEGVTGELVEALNAAGIEPAGQRDRRPGMPLTERRVAASPAPSSEPVREPGADRADEIRPGDRVALLFADRKRLTIRLTDEAAEEGHGLVGTATPLGRALVAAQEGDEIDVPLGGGPVRALIEAVERPA